MKILLAEDEVAMSSAVSAVLKHFGHEVTAARDGVEAVEAAEKNSYDCMVFDIMMPRMDGIEALKQLRRRGDTTPVIMLTAKAEVDDRISGLDAGADDYLAKPFSMGELMARIRSLTRRAEDFTPTKLKKGNVELDVAEQELSCVSAVRLSGKETKLLSCLMMNEGKELSTEELFNRVWQGEDEDKGLVWIYISYLREKLNSIHGNIEITGEQDGRFTLIITGEIE